MLGTAIPTTTNLRHLVLVTSPESGLEIRPR